MCVSEQTTCSSFCFFSFFFLPFQTLSVKFTGNLTHARSHLPQWQASAAVSDNQHSVQPVFWPVWPLVRSSQIILGSIFTISSGKWSRKIIPFSWLMFSSSIKPNQYITMPGPNLKIQQEDLQTAASQEHYLMYMHFVYLHNN